MKDLASNLLGQDFTQKKEVNNHSSVVDLVIQGLPAEASAADLRRITSVKHIVDAVVDQDAIKNVCTGTGTIRVRLGEGENAE